MYQRKSRLTSRQQGKLIEYFVLGASARAVAQITDLNRNTVRIFFHRLRKLIADRLLGYQFDDNMKTIANHKKEAQNYNTEIIQAFGLYQHSGYISVILISKQTADINFTALQQTVLDSIIYTNHHINSRIWVIADFKYRRLKYPETPTDKTHRIDRIENFWAQAKRYLCKFNGIKQEYLYCFLKECEWRFNGKDHGQLLKQLKYWYKQSKH